MMSFKKYALMREASDKIGVIARRIVENTGNTQALDQAKNQLMQTFQAEFQKDAQGALTWLNNLYSKVLPGDYKNFYAQFQKQGAGNNANANQQGQQQGQQGQDAQGQGQGQGQGGNTGGGGTQQAGGN